MLIQLCGDQDVLQGWANNCGVNAVTYQIGLNGMWGKSSQLALLTVETVEEPHLGLHLHVPLENS